MDILCKIFAEKACYSILNGKKYSTPTNMQSLCRHFFTLLFRYLPQMRHRGQLIQKAIDESGIPVKEVARRINKSRTTLYNYYSKPDLSIEIVYAIGKAIHRDFSAEISDLKGFMPFGEQVFDTGATEMYHSLAEELLEVKTKYSRLLEEHIRLLKLLEEERRSADNAANRKK